MQLQRRKCRSGVAASAVSGKASALFWFSIGAAILGGAFLLNALSARFAYEASVALYLIP